MGELSSGLFRTVLRVVPFVSRLTVSVDDMDDVTNRLLPGYRGC